jgi:DNA-binding FadR family transcriptional regulator
VTEAAIVQSLCQSKAVDLKVARGINEYLKKLILHTGQEFTEYHAFDFAMQDLEFHLALADADKNPAARRLGRLDRDSGLQASPPARTEATIFACPTT